MPSTFEIPLSGQAQTFSITLAGTLYQFTLQWRDAGSDSAGVAQGGWFLDIADQNNVPLVRGIPLVTGADLLAQYAYLGIGGQLFVSTDGAPADVPTYANLGSTSHLYFVIP